MLTRWVIRNCELWSDLLFYFFFQAEDGIRDTSVTGVQTCALPISLERPDRALPGTRCRWQHPHRQLHDAGAVLPRSEERRVGKECRSRGSASVKKKKNERKKKIKTKALN